jgi:heme A synthase
MIKALLIGLLFWVVIVPGAIGSYMILTFLEQSVPARYFLLAFLAGCVSALAAVLGPILFPLQIAGNPARSLHDREITTRQEDRSA